MNIRNILENKQNGDIVELICVVKSTNVKPNKGKPFIDVDVTDGNDSILCRKFSTGEVGIFTTNTIVKINGKVNDFNGTRSIIIDNAIIDDKYKIEEFINYDKDKLIKIYDYLFNFINENISNDNLREVTKYILKNNKEDFIKSVAAKTHHHSDPGGLLNHTKEVFSLCGYLYEAVKNTYKYDVNKDLLYCGAVLHDIGKISAYTTGVISGDLSTEGKLLDHITSSVIIIDNAYRDLGFEKDNYYKSLLHIIVSHHGQKEWGSMVEPKTIEAYIIHKADDMSAKMSEIFKALKTNTDNDGWINLNVSNKEYYNIK